MSSYPTLEQLFQAIIEDCFDYLFTHSEGQAKESITKLKEYNQDKAEIIKKSYVVICSMNNEKPSEGELSSIYDFTIKFIEAINSYLNDTNANNGKISTINDCCNGYIALFGYIYIFKGFYSNEFLLFVTKYYKYFEEILVKNNILKDVKIYYENAVNKLYKTESVKLNDEFFNEFLKFFEKESFKYQKEAIDAKGNKGKETPKNLNIELKKEEHSENGNKSAQFDTCDISNFQIDNKSIENGEHIFKNKAYEDSIKSLQGQYFHLSFKMINKDYKQVNYLESIFLKLEFNSVEINCGKKKSEYFENLIISLKNTVTNLGNPYNFNLWRKLSNIILKNLFVILNKKNYRFLQYYNKSVLNSLKSYESKFKGKQLEDFKEKVKLYEDKLKKQEEEISSKGVSAADRERNYNIIVVENQIKYTLIIDFLFFLKEKGNKINHFDEEIIDLILFDDLNINIKINEESYGKEKNDLKSEKKNVQKEEKIIQSKTSFNSEEIIDMLKNPFKYHKEDINVDKIYSAIYEKMKTIKDNFFFEENKMGYNDLKNSCEEILTDIQNLVISYENYFTENKINYLNKNENEKLDNYEEKHIENYIYIKELKKKINKKIELYNINIKTLSELKEIAEDCMQKVDNFIKEIKLNKQKKENNIISIEDVFLEFKTTLKDKKLNEQEYQKYRNIFNEKNIDEFSLENVYTILNETLNYNNASFSIIKKDVTNYNFLLEVIIEFNELKNYVYNKHLDILI